LSEKISTAPEKLLRYLQNCFAQLTPPISIGKNPEFQALHITGWYEFRFLLFNKYKKNIFFIFVSCFCPKNLAFARKNNDFARLTATAPGLYAYV